MRRILVALVLTAIASPVLAPAVAQTTVDGTIRMIRTGWNDEQFAVVLAQPMQNPARCPNADGYLAHRQFPGYNTYYSAALAAFTSRSPVGIIVHNTECAAGTGRPRLIGINIIQADRRAGNDPNAALTQLSESVNRLNASVGQIQTRADRIEQTVTTVSRQMFHPSGRSLINMIGAIHAKVGAQ